jgi:hypothetical protein
MPSHSLPCINSSVTMARLVIPLGVGITLALGLLLALAGYAVRPVAAQESKQAHVVVQMDDQARIIRPIQFSGVISGLAALQLSGLEVVTATTAFGPAVCRIEGVGCPATDCFCDTARFWNYSYWDESGWQSYPVGAHASVISQTGAVEGWRWGALGAPQVPVTPSLAAERALGWLQAQQVITDGGYGSVGTAVETMLAVGANYASARLWRRMSQGPSLADYVSARAGAYTRSGAAAAGKLAVALAGAESCLPAQAMTPQAYYSPTLSAYSEQSGPHSWAILGAVALSETVPPAALAQLQAQQLPGGGWEWAPGWGADTNTTALALQALLAAGEPVSSPRVASGVAFLHTAQQEDGGFAYAPGPSAPSDANSTAYAVQAIAAVGEDAAGPGWTVGNTTPISYLLGLQLAEGSLPWQPGQSANLLATQQAVPALLGQPFPLRRRLEHCPTLYLPVMPSR